MKSENRSLLKWTKTAPQVTGGGNLKLLFPSITVYFVDRPDIDANSGSFEALGSGGSGEVGSRTRANPDLSVILKHKISYRQNPLELSTNISSK